MWGNNVSRGLGSHCMAADQDRSPPAGEALSLAAPQILMLSKCGALSNETGEIRITWSVQPAGSGPRLHFQ
jgi:hypothetical protein